MTTNDYPHTTADLAARLNISRKTVLKRVKALGIGLDFEGRAGLRFSEADYQALVDSMKPSTPVAPRRRRRAA
jgi:Mn-dependent DtxR family transcriptional regulator